MKKPNREQLVNLVKKIRQAEGSEEEISQWIDTLHACVPHPEVSDLIFYSKDELTDEQIVDKALSYKPICL